MPVAPRGWSALLAPLGVTALAATACGVTQDSRSGVAFDGCITTNDCFTGFVCINNICDQADALTDQVVVEVTPAGGSSFVPTQFLSVSLEERPLTFELPEPTDYEVEVFDGQLQRVAANVTLFRTMGIPGREVAVDTFVSATAPAPIRLLAGTYSVILVPNEGPGLEVLGFNVRNQPESVDKIFQFPETFRRLRGQVRSAADPAVALEGVQVRAFGVVSDLASTTAISDASGAFEVLLPSTTDTFFRVEAEPPSDWQPSWSFQQTVRVEVDSDRTRDIDLYVAGPSEQGLLRLQIVGVDGSTTAAAANVRVTLTATTSGFDVPPSFSTAGTTGADGRLRLRNATTDQVPIIRGRYLVNIEPPANSPYQRRSTVLNLSTAGPGFTIDERIVLAVRPRVTGAILSAEGLEVAQALVSFQPTDPNRAPTTAVSGPTGTYEITLDPGDYEMTVEPLPLASPDLLSSVTPTPVTVQSVSVAASPTTQSLGTMSLPPGTFVEGQVIGPTGAAEGGARLDFYIIRNGAPVRLGRATSDSSGRFVIVFSVP